MPQKSTIIIVCVVLGLFGLFGLYNYTSDNKQHAPFSADEYVSRSIAEARSVAPDAEVIGLTAEFVDEAGLVHSTFEVDGYYAPGGKLAMMFRSSSHASGGGSPAMLGAPVTGKTSENCPFLYVGAGLQGGGSKSLGVESHWKDNDCRPSFPAAIRCTISQVWKRAIAAGAPHPALADIVLGPEVGHPVRVWNFEIKDRSSANKGGYDSFTVVFSRTFADDC